MITTPNMNLITPTIGVNSGLEWEQSLNANSQIIDQHNHSIGSGVQINVSGLNLTSDLPLNNNNLISTKSVCYYVQVAPLSGGIYIGCTYVSGVDLYYNDINGNQIQITAGGVVNATSSGISSGTATASFSASVLIVNAASNTPANIQGGSILIGNPGVSGSKFITLSAPNPVAANYGLVLPTIPAQTNVMTLDSSGNMSSTTWNSVAQNMSVVGADAIAASMDATGANAIAATMNSTGTNSLISTMGATGANTLANNRTRATGTSVAAGGVAVSSSLPSLFGIPGYQTSSATYVTPTNMSITITTTGKPVWVGIIPDIAAAVGTGSQVCNFNILVSSGGVNIFLAIFRGGTQVFQVCLTTGTTGLGYYAWPALQTLDFVAAGTYTYTFQVAVIKSGSAGDLTFFGTKLCAYEP